MTLITDPDLERELIARRQAHGIDQRDEVWDGVYMIYPPTENEHQAILTDIAHTDGVQRWTVTTDTE